jgi:hypothetical protein
MKKKLFIPKEPKEVKEWIKSVESRTGGPDVNWASLNVWYGNQLPKYLWKEWKGELKSNGFNWQKFLRLLKHRTDKIILWYKGIIKWEELVKEFIDLIEGPLGQNLAKK